MLTGFYHRSVLRCGRLAERKSGVTNILPAELRQNKNCIDVSRIGYPRQPGANYLQSIASETGRNRLTVTNAGSIFALMASTELGSQLESL
jgi:hypothetical protein